MKHKANRPSVISAAIGFLLGAAIFGGSAAVAAGITAHPKTAAVIIDGLEVDLRGYNIEGSHYFQLRDLSINLEPGGKDFSVEWDGQNNRVVIDTSRGYYGNNPPPTQSTTPGEPEMSIDELKAEIIRLMNNERVKAGLPELQVLPALMDCAQAKADDMRENGYFGHTSPVYGTVGEMIRSFVPESRSRGENLAPWRRTPEEFMEGLLDSPQHLENLLNPRGTHIGIGITLVEGGGFVCVQHFVRL